MRRVWEQVERGTGAGEGVGGKGRKKRRLKE